MSNNTSKLNLMFEGCIPDDITSEEQRKAPQLAINSLYLLHKIHSYYKIEQQKADYNIVGHHINQALRIYPLYPWALMVKGISLQLRNGNKEALELLDLAQLLGLDNILLYLSRFLIKLKANDVTGAKAELSNGVRKAKDDTELFNFLFALDTIIEEHHDDLKQMSNPITLFLKLNQTQFQTNPQTDSHFKICQEGCLNDGYNNPNKFGIKGDGYYKPVPNTPAAHCVEAMKLLHATPLINDEVSLKALQLSETSLRLNKKYAFGYLVRSLAYLDLGEYEKGLEDINQSFSLGLENEYHLQIRALLNKNLKEYERALVDIEKALSLNRSSTFLSGMHYIRLECLIGLGDKRFAHTPAKNNKFEFMLGLKLV